MLFNSIVQLPFFDSFKTNRHEELIGELEMENNEAKVNMSSFMDTTRNDIKIKTLNDNISDGIKSKCKC